MDREKQEFEYIKPFKEAINVALVYLVVSVIWIVFSDRILLRLVPENTLLFREIQTYKGVGYVFISSVLMFLMVYHRVNSLLKLRDELSKHKKLTQAKLDYMGLHDSLTGLPKRLLLEKRFLILTEGLYKDKNIALVHIEIDNLVQINETLGNMAGDQLIKDLSNSIDELITGDGMLARLNQGAFGVLLTNVESYEDIDSQVKDILKFIERPWIYDGKRVFIDAIAGIATYPEDCLEFYSLLRYSNIALKYAKLKNREKFEYYSIETEIEITDNLEMTDNIKKALTNNEFRLNYQMVMNLQKKEIAGVETLIRWNHPEKGNIPPLNFIPISEQSNLIVEITDFVINMALQQKNKWKEDNYLVPKISVNISPRSMNTVGFCYYIEGKLQEYNINGNELILELTESTFIEEFIELDENIKYLRNLGVEIALDDFGTGYSTLARLKDLNIDYLKLDSSFIMNLSKNSNDEVLVRSVIEVANVLNITVVAEGIETMEGLKILTDLGCTLGQGYFIHKPSDTLPLDFIYDL